MLVFLFAVLISFAGSLQIGVLSTNIVHATVHYGKKQGYFVALGGTLPEFIYAFIAVYAIQLLKVVSGASKALMYAPILILVSVGLYFLFSAQKEIKQPEEVPGKRFFFTGFGIAAINPQLITFWAGILLYLQSMSWLYSGQIYEVICFVTGAGIGAFLLFHCLITITHKNRETVLQLINKYKLYRIIGLLLIIMALLKLYLLIN